MQSPQLSGSAESHDLMSMIATNNEVDNRHSFETKVFQKNKYIYFSGDQSDCIYFIKKGRVKVGSQLDFEKKLIKGILTEGDFFGEFSLFGLPNHLGFALAMEETTLRIIPCFKLKAMMRTHRELNFYLIKVLGARLIETEQRIEALVFKDSRTRVIDFLNNFVEKYGKKVGYEVVIWKVLTHQEIANFTATSRQTVTTVLNELRKKNILTFDRHRLLIRDMELLNAEAA